MTRKAALARTTSEVSVRGQINLDGTGESTVSTGLGFFDHMLACFAKHAGMDLELEARGDIAIDDHHTIEDCAIVLGRGLDNALGSRRGIKRFGYSYVAMDETLARSVVDLSGRPWSEIHLEFSKGRIGDLSSENLVHFFRTLAIESRMALHLDLVRGDNDHHKAEAAFKATAIAFRDAASPGATGIPSTKEILG